MISICESSFDVSMIKYAKNVLKITKSCILVDNVTLQNCKCLMILNIQATYPQSAFISNAVVALDWPFLTFWYFNEWLMYQPWVQKLSCKKDLEIFAVSAQKIPLEPQDFVSKGKFIEVYFSEEHCC